MLGRNGQVFMPPLCSAFGWGLPEKIEKLRRTLKALTAGGYQLTTFLEAGLLSPFLERDLSAAILRLPKISLNIASRGWLTIGHNSQSEEFRIRRDLESDDPIGPF